MKLKWESPTPSHTWQAKYGILLFQIWKSGNGEFETELRFDYGIDLNTGTQFGGSIQNCRVAYKYARSLKEAKENALLLYERFMKEITHAD